MPVVFQTLMHELGHNLGLDHSNVRGSVMWPSIIRRPSNFDLKPQPDDVRRIQALYGAGTGSGGVQTLPPGQPTGGQVKTKFCKYLVNPLPSLTDSATTTDSMDSLYYWKATISDNI